MAPDFGFEAALRRLEQAVEELEAGDLGLDGALAKYEEGVRLLARCHGLLDGAERKVALLTGVDATGAATTAPFDASATADREPPTAADPSSDGADDAPL
jgi:exodeoxyribonuclease VII small subunit